MVHALNKKKSRVVYCYWGGGFGVSGGQLHWLWRKLKLNFGYIDEQVHFEIFCVGVVGLHCLMMCCACGISSLSRMPNALSHECSSTSVFCYQELKSNIQHQRCNGTVTGVCRWCLKCYCFLLLRLLNIYTLAL